MTSITLSHQRHGFLTNCLQEHAEPIARSQRFTVYEIDPHRKSKLASVDPHNLIVVHDFSRNEIDNNISSFVADELLPLVVRTTQLEDSSRNGVNEQEVFEHYVGEIIRSMDGDERRAWRLFYDNTLVALHRFGRLKTGSMGEGSVPRDYVAEFAAIYRRVADLVAESRGDSLLDAATCFGFLPLLLASDDRLHGPNIKKPLRIVACDINPALVGLADDYARQRQLTGVRFVRADILASDLADKLVSMAMPYDVVTAIHVLEHLEPEQTEQAVNALWSLAVRRLIVAVPIEEVPDERFGHRQVFDRERLTALGRSIGGVCRYFEDHGAWLVVDRNSNDRSH